MDRIEINRKYFISRSLSNENHSTVGAACLQYSFRPASIDSSASGVLALSSANDTATVTFPNNEVSGKTVSLKGTLNNLVQNEYVLIFREERFQILPIWKSVIGLKHERDEDVRISSAHICTNKKIKVSCRGNKKERITK